MYPTNSYDNYPFKLNELQVPYIGKVFIHSKHFIQYIDNHYYQSDSFCHEHEYTFLEHRVLSSLTPLKIESRFEQSLSMMESMIIAGKAHQIEPFVLSLKGRVPRLRKLYIECTDRFSTAHIQAINLSKYLHTLSLSDDFINYEHLMRFIENSIVLRHLFLEDCTANDVFYHALCSSVKKNHSLRTLGYSGKHGVASQTNFSPMADVITTCTTLKHLRFTDNTQYCSSHMTTTLHRLISQDEQKMQSTPLKLSSRFIHLPALHLVLIGDTARTLSRINMTSIISIMSNLIHLEIHQYIEAMLTELTQALRASRLQFLSLTLALIEIVDDFAKMITENTTIQTYYLNILNLAPECAIRIINAFRTNQTAEHLDVKCIKSLATNRAFKSMLMCNRFLRCFGHDNESDNSQILDALEYNSSLEILNVRISYQDNLKALLSNRSIRRLNYDTMMRNFVFYVCPSSLLFRILHYDSFITIMSEILRHDTSLEVLHLQIIDNAQCVFDSLAYNRSIRELHLIFEEITDALVKTWTIAMIHNQTIENLTLIQPSNGILEALIFLPSLRVLTVSDNDRYDIICKIIMHSQIISLTIDYAHHMLECLSQAVQYTPYLRTIIIKKLPCSDVLPIRQAINVLNPYIEVTSVDCQIESQKRLTYLAADAFSRANKILTTDAIPTEAFDLIREADSK